MTCEQAAAQAGRYLDSDEDALTPIGRHVAECPRCQRLAKRRRDWRLVVQEAPRFEPRDPEALAARLRAAIATTPLAAAPVVKSPSKPPSEPPQRWFIAAAAIAATFLCVSATVWIWVAILRGGGTPAGPNLVAHEVVSSHIRSLMGQHLTDVPSSDRHTVKPWFAGKVPFSLTVPDFQAQGVALEGGRLDYVNGRTVAALVYRRRQHVINVFVWPLSANDPAMNDSRSESGYEAIAWTARGQQHWAVSDVNDAELRQFIDLFQREE
jgi:anti-sigma factor RsiW